MAPLLLIALVAGAVSGATVLILLSVGQLLAWAVFLGWASFSAIGGTGSVIALNITSNLLGVFAAWLVATLSLLNPLPESLSFDVWISILVFGAVVAYVLASRIRMFSSLTASSIAFAGSYGYLAHAPGAYTLDALLSFSMQNALIIMSASIVLGTLVGVLAGKVIAFFAARLPKPTDS